MPTTHLPASLESAESCPCIECNGRHCGPTAACEFECANHGVLHWGWRFGFELAAVAIQAANWKRTNDAAKALAFGMLSKAVA